MALAAGIDMAPCRLLDTRYPNGPFAGPTFTPGAVRTFNVPAGGCGVPNAAAYSVNFTLVNYVGTSGYITAFPAGGTPPGVSTVNFGSGLPINNAAIVPTTNGSFEIYATGTTDVIADMNGILRGKQLARGYLTTELEPAVASVLASSPGATVNVSGTKV